MKNSTAQQAQNFARQNVELPDIGSKKACSMCKISKDLTIEFYHKSSSDKSGFQHKCKDCCKKWHSNRKSETSNKRAEYRVKNREKINKQKRNHHHENKQRLNAISRDNHHKNKAERNKASKDWYQDNKAYVREYGFIHRDKNKKEIKVRGEKYRANNKEKIKESKANYCKTKSGKAHLFYRRSLRRIYDARYDLFCTGDNEDLGYTRDQFINHIESLWLKGMSWDNHSPDGWHIDHIKPISLFIKEGITYIKIINALSNLQPLWAKDNMSKGAKYNDPTDR